MVKERIRYIDIIESIAILLVIYCHYTLTIGESVFANITLQFTTAIAVPLFFMANGTLLFNAKFDFKKYCLKTVFLLVTTIVWKALYLFIMLAGRGFDFSLYTLKELYVYFGPSSFADPYIPSVHFWFLYALIALYLVFPIFKYLYDKASVWLLGLFILAGIVLVYKQEILREYSMSFAIEYTSYLIFFLIGPIVHNVCFDKKIGYKAVLFLVASVLSFMVLIYQRYQNFGTLIGAWERLPLDYQRIATLVMATAFYAFFASIDFKETKATRYFEFVSVRTMNIYVIHGMIGYLFEVYITPLLPYQDVFVHLARSILILGISVLVTEPLSYIPGISKLLGFRKQSFKSKETV